MTKSARIGIISGVIAGALVIIIVAVFVIRANIDNTRAGAPASTAASTAKALTPTHVLGEEGDGAITVVEFLDFECEACGAFYPYVEQLRKDYAGKITFGFRYFPLPGHGNSRTSASAVEAAARQNQLDPMYQRMYETQAEWGERGTDSQADRFRGYAEDLGLDMRQYDRDVDSSSVQKLIQDDVNLGTQLGVSSTPTFFINGKPVTLQSYTDLQDAVDAALEEAQ